MYQLGKIFLPSISLHLSLSLSSPLPLSPSLSISISLSLSSSLPPLSLPQPSLYVAHLVGHEGAGSLLSFLKSKHWCNTLLAGPELGAKGFMFFSVTMDLTEEGMGRYLIGVIMPHMYMYNMYMYMQGSSVCPHKIT